MGLPIPHSSQEFHNGKDIEWIFGGKKKSLTEYMNFRDGKLDSEYGYFNAWK